MKINIKLKRIRKLKHFNQGDTVFIHETEESKEHMKNYGLEDKWELFIDKRNKLVCEYHPTGEYPRIRILGKDSLQLGYYSTPRQCLYKIKYYDNKISNKKAAESW